MQAMLLAAGLGTRLRPYTLVRPKPLFPVLNVPLLHLLLDMLVRAGCDRVVVNCHHLAGQIASATAGRPEVILQREPEILGTGGGLRRALDLFDDGPVLVMNGDIYHDIDLHVLLHSHIASGLPVSMAMHDYERFNSVSVLKDRVQCFFSMPPLPGSELLAFTGIHVLDTEVIRQIPEQGFSHIIDLYARLAVEGQVGSVRVDGAFWRDIGTPQDYLTLHRELLCNRGADKMLSAGNTLSGFWCISERAEVADTVVFRDWGVVGPGAVIADHVELSRCLVWENVSVPAGQRLTDRIVC